MTKMIKIENRDYGNPSYEFRSEFYQYPAAAFQGSYVGIEKDGERSFLHYQFHGVLLGSTNRILDIHISKDRSFALGGKVFESRALEPELAKANLSSSSASLGLDEERPEVIQPHTMRLYASEEDGFLEYYVTNAPQNSLEWETYLANSELEWIKRDRATLRRMKLRYLYSVPFDVVTAPLQFVYFLFMRSSGAPG